MFTIEFIAIRYCLSKIDPPSPVTLLPLGTLGQCQNSLGPKFLSLGHFQSIEHLKIP